MVVGLLDDILQESGICLGRVCGGPVSEASAQDTMVGCKDRSPLREQRVEPVGGVFDRPILGVLCQKLSEVVVRKGLAGGHDA